MIIVYENEIQICQILGNQLEFDNRIRLTGPAYVLEPDEWQQSIFIVLKNINLIQYNLFTK